MEKEGRLNDAQVGAVEIRQYSAMKQLSQKINLQSTNMISLLRKYSAVLWGKTTGNLLWEIKNFYFNFCNSIHKN